MSLVICHHRVMYNTCADVSLGIAAFTTMSSHEYWYVQD